MKKCLLLVILIMVTGICLAQTPVHPNWVTFERTGSTTGTIRWSSEPSANVEYYYLAVHPTITQYYAPAYCDPDWNVPGGWAAGFVPESPGVLFQNVTNLDPAYDYFAYVAAVETQGWSWAAYSSWEPGVEPPLPVELSSFTTSITASNFVALAWTTQSETNLLGYRIYRSENQNLNEALMITNSLIPATNSSSESNYYFEDMEVESNTTYWYWLESVEQTGGDMHGPISIMVTDDEPGVPNLPETTEIGKVYPNPFQAGNTANLDVSVKAGEVVELALYNSRGQIIRNLTIPEGIHQVNWNGTDSNGIHCSSGIYFYRLSSPSITQTRRFILMK